MDDKNITKPITEQPETRACKHCGKTLTKVVRVMWVDMSTVAAMACNVAIPGPGVTVSLAPACLHEPAKDGETPSGYARTMATYHLGGRIPE